MLTRSKLSLSIILIMVFLLAISGNVMGQEYNDTFDKIKDEEVLTIGLAASEPGAFFDVDTGEWNGFLVDAWKKLASDLEYDVEFVETSWDMFQISLQNENFDFFGNHTFYTSARAKNVAYTTPLFYKGVGLVANKDDNRFKTIQDVKELSENEEIIVGVRMGAVEEEIIPKNFPDVEIESYKTDTASEIAMAVKAKNVDLWAADEVMQHNFLKENEWAKSIGVVGAHPVGLVVRYEDQKLLSFLNEYIEYLRSSGELATYFDKYGQPIGTLYAPKY